MKKPLFICLIALLLLSGCVSAPSAKPKGESAPPPAESAPSSEIPTASMNVSPNEDIKSVDSGALVARYDPLPAGFKDAIVVSTKRTYFQGGGEKTSEFQLVYSGVAIDPGLPAEIKDEAKIGKAVGETVVLVARSKELDPYLVACTNTKPAFDKGYWYFVPGMYISSEMKWLSFEPVKVDGFRWMYDHALEPENAMSFTSFNWWSLLKTELAEYPSEKENNGETTCDQVISLDGMALHLYYQEGFLDYLKNEYALGDPIYLYLQISGVDGFTKEFQCYVRDFSLAPPEEIVERRIQSITEGDTRI